MKARSFEETFIRPGQTTFVRPLGDNKVVHSQTTTQDGNHIWRHVDYWPEATAIEIRIAQPGDQTVVIDGAHRLPKLAK